MKIEKLERTAMLLAPLLFAASMIVIWPYLQELRALSGAENGRLSAIRQENINWTVSHVLMALGAGLYVPAFIQILAPVVRARPLFGRLLRLICVTGAVGLVGQMAIDLATGVMSRSEDLTAMSRLVEAMENDPSIDILFFTIANLCFVVGFLLLGVYAIVSRTIPRLTGILVIGGWLVIILLNGLIPYSQALGHFLIFGGFLVAFVQFDRAD